MEKVKSGITFDKVRDKEKEYYAMKLMHFDDGKEKSQSHEISIFNQYEDIDLEINCYVNDLNSVIGFGATKEEALEDFKEEFDYTFKRWEEFRNKLFNSELEVLEK